MSALIPLSTVRVAPDTGIVRDCPRPEHLRNETFHDRFDWDTLFYDVYRVGPHVVFQGPPYFSFLERLKESAPFRGAFGIPFFRARHFGQDKRGEIWLRSDADVIDIDCSLGRFSVAVQPNHADMFADRRVLLTISRDNRIEWIEDWIRFYRDLHGADGVLLYDNGSSSYSAEELQNRLRAEFADMAIVVVDWRFAFGPSGGRAGAVNGVDAPWDSDFCQPGKTQHGRWRFLQLARSVLNIDIDELVIANGTRTVFEAAEADGFSKFEGQWISNALPEGATPDSCRHADFVMRQVDATACPPKWAVAPLAFGREASWSVHNIFGPRANRIVSQEFTYRHLKGISTSWKYDRWSKDIDPATLACDDELVRAFARAGLHASARALEKS